jgi:glycosyltransferase involved in cell wall biosynthesis
MRSTETDIQVGKTRMLTNQKSIRILHVVHVMNRGGIETWLLDILRQIDRESFQMDFMVHTAQPGAYSEEFRTLGSRIIPCLDLSRPWLYAANFKQILREYGPFDVVHSHVHHFSGYVLRLAKQAGVTIRIAHSHTDTSQLPANKGLYRRFYLALMKWWIARYATTGLACSRQAAVDLFGSAWQSDSRWQLLYCGIDLNLFRDNIDSVAVRSELGIPADAFVIGHVGRFHEQKNHSFLLDIAAEVARREPRMCLLLVGDGSLRRNIEDKIAQMGLTNHVIFAGSRPDVQKLMQGAMDIFLLPSLYEGLPLVLLEAQAAGLSCVFSDVVTEEADVVKPLLRRVGLSQSASKWAEVLLTQRSAVSATNQSEALSVVESSPFNIKKSVKQYMNLIQENVGLSVGV